MSHSADRMRESASSRPVRIVGLFPELLGVGGVQEAGRQTAAALDEIGRRRGWSLDVLSLNDEPGARVLRAAEQGIPLRGFGRAKLHFVLSALGQARSDTRIVLAAHPHLAVPAEIMKLRVPGLKTIIMSHGIEVWERMSPLRRQALRRSDRVLAPSSDTARKLADVQSLPAENIRKLPWPLNSQMLRLADAPANLLLPAEFPQGQVVLTVGRWAAAERYKGADDLIEAIAQLRPSFSNLRLVAVGGGDDLPRLRKLAADAGVADRVSFLEGLTREQIAACYARCDVFALPSTGEGFGLVFLEAMAFGKPVVGADSGGIPDLVQHDVNGLLIPPRSRERLVDVLGLLLHDRAMCARLGSQGAEVVRRKYSVAVFERELEQILEDAGVDSIPLK
ncbi:MAG: glycosyltransferase family 4 protein [Candidatus Acidiferrales bacterium]